MRERHGHAEALQLGTKAELVKGIQEGKQQADGNGFDPGALQGSPDFPHFLDHQVLLDPTGANHPPPHAEAQRGRDEMRLLAIRQIVEAASVLSANLDEVFKAGVGDEGGPGAPLFQESIGGNR